MPEVLTNVDVSRIFLNLGVSSDGLFGGCIKPASLNYLCPTEAYVRGALVPRYLRKLESNGQTVYDAKKRDCSKFAIKFLDFCNDDFAESDVDLSAIGGPCAVAVAKISGPAPWNPALRHQFAALIVEAQKIIAVETVYSGLDGAPPAMRFYDLTGYDWTQVSLLEMP